MWLACGADDEPHVHVLAFLRLTVDGCGIQIQAFPDRSGPGRQRRWVPWRTGLRRATTDLDGFISVPRGLTWPGPKTMTPLRAIVDRVKSMSGLLFRVQCGRNGSSCSANSFVQRRISQGMTACDCPLAMTDNDVGATQVPSRLAAQRANRGSRLADVALPISPANGGPTPPFLPGADSLASIWPK